MVFVPRLYLPSSVSAVKKCPQARAITGASFRSISLYSLNSIISTWSPNLISHSLQYSGRQSSPQSPGHWWLHGSSLVQRLLQGRRLHGAEQGIVHSPWCGHDHVHRSIQGAHASWHLRSQRECLHATYGVLKVRLDSVVHGTCLAPRHA